MNDQRWHRGEPASLRSSAGARGADAANQRRGRDVPEAPIYSKWFSEYNKLHPNVEINYQSIGSGGGIRQLTSQTVFFGATDGPMTNDQLLAAPGQDPASSRRCSAPCVPVYNIPDVSAELKFTGRGARRHLPRQDHEVERPGDREAERRREPAGDRHHRRAPRPTARARRYIWVDYLAKVSPEWKTKVGVATSVELADRRRRQGQRGRRRPRHADARLDRLRRADLRAAEQDQLRLGAEHGRRVHRRRRSSR